MIDTRFLSLFNHETGEEKSDGSLSLSRSEVTPNADLVHRLVLSQSIHRLDLCVLIDCISKE